MNGALTIRRAREDDAPPLAALLEQLGYPLSPAVVRSRLQTSGDWEVYLGVDGSEPIAMLILAERDDFIDGREARIEGLVVADGRRGTGIGAELLAFAERWARSRGLSPIVVRSNTIRTRAHVFYERAGYSKRKSQYVLEKTL